MAIRVRVVLRSDDQTGAPAIMGFRHDPLGVSARNAVQPSSRLVLNVLAGAEMLAEPPRPPEFRVGSRS